MSDAGHEGQGMPPPSSFGTDQPPLSRSPRLVFATVALIVGIGACSPMSSAATADSSTSVPSPSARPSTLPSPTLFNPLTFPSRAGKPLALIASPGPPLALASSGDAVWILDGTEISRIDPATNRVTKTARAAGTVLTFGFGSLWTADFDSSTVARVDPASGQTTATIHVDTADGVTSTAQGIWVTEHHVGSVALIDPRTNTIAAVVVVGSEGTGGPQAIRMIGDLLWVGVPKARQLVAINPETRQIVERIPGLPDPCGEMAIAAGSIWVTECEDEANIDQADPVGASFTSRIWLGGYAGTPLPVSDGVWLPVAPERVDLGGRMLKLGATGEPVDALDLGPDCLPSQNLMPALLAFNSVWIGCDNGTVVRLAATDLP